MRNFVVIFFIFINMCPVFAYYGGQNFNSKLSINRPNIIYAGSDKIQQRYRHRHCPCPSCEYWGYNTISPANLNALERHALKKNYKRESDLERIQRLETLAFGAIQEGDINSRFYNLEQAILSMPQVSTQNNSVLSSLTNFFKGHPTGFTPSLSDSFMPTFNPYPSGSLRNRQYEQYSNMPFGSGWGFSDQNFNGGTSVRILD